MVSVLKDSQSDMALYLRNIFKKRGQPAATHVLVLMVSDERRNHKPYALPVQYIPYYSLKDQYVHDFTEVLKEHMVQLGLPAVGELSYTNPFHGHFLHFLHIRVYAYKTAYIPLYAYTRMFISIYELAYCSKEKLDSTKN